MNNVLPSEPASEVPSESLSASSSSPPPISSPHPSSRTLLLLTVFTAILAYAICLNLRLVEAPAWNQEQFHVHGEPLMATHDAYYFLAGGQGTARPDPAHAFFFNLTRVLHGVTGLSFGHLGFWLPVLLAPLVVFPLAWLAWREGLPEAVLPMGVLAGGTMGFLARTRLGYYDHDMLSLLLPVLFITGLLLYLHRWLPATSGRGEADRVQAGLPPGQWQAFAASCLLPGFLGWVYVAFYASGRTILLSICIVGCLLALLLDGDARRRGLLCLGMGVILLLALEPVWGFILLGALALTFGPLAPWFGKGWSFGLLLLGGGVFVVFGANLDSQLAELARQLAKYSPLLPEGNQTADILALPSVMQSVREARSLPLLFMAERSGATWWLFAVGVVGYCYLCLRRPLYLLFAPLLALSLGAVTLGARFTMYGGVPSGLGLGLGLALLLDRLGLRQRVRAVILSAFALVAAMLLMAQAESLKPNPVLSPAYAETLLHLRDLTPPDARIWTWWDYGYAVQYYAQRATFADGARNSREILFPLALVHATATPRQAAQTIAMVTTGQMRAWSAHFEDALPQGDVPWRLFLQPPLTMLEGMNPEQAQEFIDSLAVHRSTWPDNLPAQYVLFSWQNLSLAPWITHFGNWNLETGQGTAGRLQRIASEVSADLHAGTLRFADESTVNLDAFLAVSDKGIDEFTWDGRTGNSAVFIEASNQLLLMDQTMYASMLVQMLLNDPSFFTADFELILDNAPWTRVYRVRPGTTGWSRS